METGWMDLLFTRAQNTPSPLHSSCPPAHPPAPFCLPTQVLWEEGREADSWHDEIEGFLALGYESDHSVPALLPCLGPFFPPLPHCLAPNLVSTQGPPPALPQQQLPCRLQRSPAGCASGMFG